MKFCLSNLLALLLVAPAMAAPQPMVGVYQFKSQADAKFTLPEFAVYRADGQRIWQNNGFADDFIESLEAKLKENRPDGGVLKDAMKFVEPRLPVEDKENKFIFVEYWADWCAPCHHQKKAIQEWLIKHPEQKISWFYIEKDAMGGGHKKTAQDLAGSSVQAQQALTAQELKIIGTGLQNLLKEKSVRSIFEGFKADSSIKLSVNGRKVALSGNDEKAKKSVANLLEGKVLTDAELLHILGIN